MGTAILDIPKGACPPPSEVGTLGAFLVPSPVSEKKLVRSDERLIRELVSVLDRQLIAAVETRSVAEFKAVRENVMPRYVRALRALYDTLINLVSGQMIDSISEGIFAELADDLEKQRDSRFGDKLTDQAVFTLWTVRRIGMLARQIMSAGKVPEHKRQADNKLGHEYYVVSLWAQFHLDMLFAATRYDRPVCEEIRETICDGLRAAVNAYVIMKDALSLRMPRVEEATHDLNLPWDEEDEELLASSMREMHAKPGSDH